MYASGQLSDYSEFNDKLKRRVESLAIRDDREIQERYEIFESVRRKVEQYVKDFPADNLLRVQQCELVGSIAENTCIGTPQFDLNVIIRVPQCNFSDPEPPNGYVIPNVFMRRQSIQGNQLQVFAKSNEAGTHHTLIAAEITSHVFQLINKAISYYASIPGNFSKHTFKFEVHDGVANHAATVDCDADSRLLVLMTDKRVGKVTLTIVFRAVIECEQDGAKMQVLSTQDDHWKVTFATRERNMIKDADKMDDGCRKSCLKLMKAFLAQNMPSLVHKSGRFFSIAKTLLFNEMKRTGNIARCWKNEELGNRFFGMLHLLLEDLHRGEMPHYFSKFMGNKNNLFNSISGSVLKDCHAKLVECLNKPDEKLFPSIRIDII